MYTLRLFARALIGAAPSVCLVHALLAQQPPGAPARDTVRRDSIARLTTVTVTAARPERAAPLNATHVDAASIRQTPAQSSYDLLRQAAGVEVHETGQGPGFASDASLRGFSSDHSTDIALWVDGVPVNEPVNGHAEGYNDWSVLFPGGIQEIDVIHGPSDARFGNFGLAGVVNVRTIERMRGTEITAGGGSFGLADGMVLSGFDHGAAGGGVLGVRAEREQGFRPNERFGIAQGHARLTRELARGVTLDGGVELYGGDWRSAGFLSEDEFARRDYGIVSNPSDGGFKRRAQERVSLRVLRGTAFWRTTAYATQGRWQLFLTTPPAGGRLEGSSSQTEEEDRRAGYGATTAITWPIARGEITVGGEGRLDRADYQNFFTTVRTRDSTALLVTARQSSGGVFVQSHVDAAEWLRLDIGGRYDALSTRSLPNDTPDALSATHGVASPKLGAMLRLAPALGLYANVSRGFRSTDGIITEPSLRPITAWAYESGLKVDRANASGSLAVFRMNVSDEQTFDPVTLTSSSGGSSRRQGVELDWRGPILPWAAIATEWTFNDARYTSIAAVPAAGGGPPVVLDGLRVYNTSKYVGAASLDVGRTSEWWRLRIAGNWVGPYSPFDEPGVVLGGYGLLHLSAVARIGRFEVDAGVRNALDRAYPELVAAHFVAPGRPRALFVSISARF